MNSETFISNYKILRIEEDAWIEQWDEKHRNRWKEHIQHRTDALGTFLGVKL